MKSPLGQEGSKEEGITHIYGRSALHEVLCNVVYLISPILGSGCYSIYIRLQMGRNLRPGNELVQRRSGDVILFCLFL